MNRINGNVWGAGQYADHHNNFNAGVNLGVNAKVKDWNVNVQGGIDKNGQKHAELKFDKEF